MPGTRLHAGMSPLAVRLLERCYDPDQHPERVFERRVVAMIGTGTRVLLDAGCGRTAPVLRGLAGRVERALGVDLLGFTEVPPGAELVRADVAALPFQGASVDLVVARSLFEHLREPQAVYRELARVLRPGGAVLFMTGNMWDYGTLIARLVPNRFHARVVRAVEGRLEEDTFPTAYRSNTQRDVRRLAEGAGLRVARIEYLSQYPNYMMFSGFAFALGMAYERLVSRFHALRFLRGWMLVTLEKPQVRAC